MDVNIDLIRKMSDSELKKYIKTLSKVGDTSCYLCDKPRANYVINVQNKKKSQQKKLCSLCDICYEKMLKYLDCYDANWN